MDTVDVTDGMDVTDVADDPAKPVYVYRLWFCEAKDDPIANARMAFLRDVMKGLLNLQAATETFPAAEFDLPVPQFKIGDQMWMLHNDTYAAQHDMIPRLQSVLTVAKFEVNMFQFCLALDKRGWGWPALTTLLLQTIMKHLKALGYKFAFGFPDDEQWVKLYTSEYGVPYEYTDSCDIELTMSNIKTEFLPVQTHVMLLNKDAAAKAKADYLDSLKAPFVAVPAKHVDAAQDVSKESRMIPLAPPSPQPIAGQARPIFVYRLWLCEAKGDPNATDRMQFLHDFNRTLGLFKTQRQIWMLHDDIHAAQADRIPPLSSALHLGLVEENWITKLIPVRGHPEQLRTLLLRSMLKHLYAQDYSIIFAFSTTPQLQTYFTSEFGMECPSPNYCTAAFPIPGVDQEVLPVQTHRKILDDALHTDKTL